MQIISSFSELQEVRNQISGSLGLVPTMGALHDGHLSLVRKISAEANNVMVSIFVNPTQFGPGEDFAKYPRMVDEDVAKLKGLVEYVYIPEVKDIYPDGEVAKIHITGELNQVLEAKFRPTHFDGVATVVNILFQQTKPTHAIFGEKDYQQLLVIEQMAAESSEPIKILSGEILREADGLAMSSRNKYLTAEERKIAPLLYKNLKSDNARQVLETAGFQIQYLEKKWQRILVAAYLGQTRLIDNVPA